MSDYEIGSTQVSTPLLTLAAGAQDSVTLSTPYVGEKVTVVVHSAATALWITADGRDPNPALGYAYPAFQGSNTIAPPAWPTVIRVHATSPTTYSVEK